MLLLLLLFIVTILQKFKYFPYFVVNTVDFWNVLCTAAYCADAKVRVTVELLPLFFIEDEKLLIGQQTDVCYSVHFVKASCCYCG